MKMISTKYFVNCGKLESQFICNSIILEMADPFDKCMEAVLNEKTEHSCEYTRIDFRNYLIQLEPQILYCVIVKPITLRIECGEKKTQFHLEGNEKINFSDQCSMFRVSGDSNIEGDTFSSTEIDTPLYKPNLSIFDSSINEWTYDIQPMNKYDIPLEVLKTQTEAVTKSTHLSKRTKYHFTYGNIFERAWSWTTDTLLNSFFTKFIISIVCTCLIICTALKCYRK